MHLAVHDPVPYELPQLLDEHLLADPGELPAQLSEAARARDSAQSTSGFHLPPTTSTAASRPHS